MTENQSKAIQQDAERAANMGWTPNQMCPHPFSSEQGRYWVACYEAEWGKRYGLRQVDEDGGAGVYHVERRGK